MYVLLIWIYFVSTVKSEFNMDDIIMAEYNLNDDSRGILNTKFKINRRKNRLKNDRIRLLDKYLFNKTMYVEGIAHHKIDEWNDDIKLIKNIEKEFRNIIGMKGVKYVYKRDYVWRTWREVKHISGKDIICYKCQNIVKANCSNCHSGGYWIIEEKPPPCPYELFSLHTDEEICAANYTEFKKIKSSCTTLIKFSDLFVNCDNPIETKYMIQRDFKAISERYPNVICNRRENCQISTEYVINNEEIIFRIINSTNNIIYSRVMKSGENNYACVNDCGNWNPDTKKVSNNEESLLLNLLDRKLYKKKRENDKITKNIRFQMKNTHKRKWDSTLGIKKKIHGHEYSVKKENYDFNIKQPRHTKIYATDFEVTTLSHCKRLEQLGEVFKDESETTDYEY